MATDFIRQQIAQLLQQASQALANRDWVQVRDRAEDILALDPENQDATALLAAVERRIGSTAQPGATAPIESPTVPPVTPPPSHPTSFANGRYQVQRFLREGGKKRVYLAHDSRLDRDVAFALIKAEGLDDSSRERVGREAQAMGRLGDHPHIVTVFDIGEEPSTGSGQGTQPYMVTELMGGGDVEGVIEGAPEHRVPLEQALRIVDQVCAGLEFAHGHGIVHRDLKPGNVWLTADPSAGPSTSSGHGSGQATAKIGDFGLAVAVDRSRLTREGMMVGTVSYMPPEQAMGGEVTARSDLYALGALLYELVTGRPPFVGDDSVAIIGQHLNTPPVSPTWHRPECPPGLETLILRLLEKDTSKRPASAAEVRGALASVDLSRPSVQSAQSADAMAGGGAASAADNPLYRHTFVGREGELKQLQAAFDGALSGQGGLLMVAGEPGIGKTALCEQLATYAAMRGGKALVGHCYEEGSLSLPYLPFIEAIRSYVLAREPEDLRRELGSAATDVARIVSEVRDKVQVEPRPSGDPEDDRGRLYQGVTGFLRNASGVQPLLLILEDLHWADRGTLDFLVHLSRNLSGARLLVVGTYRDVEVDRSHPLSPTLAELRRGSEGEEHDRAAAQGVADGVAPIHCYSEVVSSDRSNLDAGLPRLQLAELLLEEVGDRVPSPSMGEGQGEGERARQGHARLTST